MVAGDPRGSAPAEGPALLSSPRRECRDGVHRLRLRTEFAPGQLGCAAASPASARNVCPARGWHLPALVPAAPALNRPDRRWGKKKNGTPASRRSHFQSSPDFYFLAGTEPVAPSFSLASCCFLYSSIASCWRCAICCISERRASLYFLESTGGPA